MFKKFLKSKSGEVFLGMMLGIVEIVAVATIGLSAIVMQSGGNTVSQARYASFAQQFGEFSDQVKIDAMTIMAETGKKGKSISNAQKFHMVANGFYDLNEGDNEGAYKMQVPVGYVIPDVIKKALRYSEEDNNVVAYLITDQIINGYEFREDLKFYSDEKTDEYHFVTSDGTVFTIPGYSEKQEDGSIKYYVTSQGHYYVVGKDLRKSIKAKDFTKLYGKDYDGKIINKSPIYDVKLKKKVEIKKDLSNIKRTLLDESVSDPLNAMLFSMQIGEYSDNATIMNAVTMAEYGKNGINTTGAQRAYVLATGNELPKELIPMGKNLNYEFLEDDEIGYEITDDRRISSDYSKNEKLLSSINENEKHYITSTGRVFVLPGYKVVRENGDVLYYVNQRDSYRK